MTEVEWGTPPPAKPGSVEVWRPIRRGAAVASERMGQSSHPEKLDHGAEHGIKSPPGQHGWLDSRRVRGTCRWLRRVGTLRRRRIVTNGLLIVGLCLAWMTVGYAYGRHTK